MAAIMKMHKARGELPASAAEVWDYMRERAAEEPFVYVVLMCMMFVEVCACGNNFSVASRLASV
jgi:hypothetical protein